MLQCDGKIDDLGDTLDSEAAVPVAKAETLSVDRVDADAEVVCVGFAQLRNVACNAPFADVWTGMLQRAGKFFFVDDKLPPLLIGGASEKADAYHRFTL